MSGYEIKVRFNWSLGQHHQCLQQSREAIASLRESCKQVGDFNRLAKRVLIDAREVLESVHLVPLIMPSTLTDGNNDLFLADMADDHLSRLIAEHASEGLIADAKERLNKYRRRLYEGLDGDKEAE